MAVKTITIELDVYERLRRLKKDDRESFSQVLRRTLPEGGGTSASELLAMVREHRSKYGVLTDEQVAQIESGDEPLEFKEED